MSSRQIIRVVDLETTGSAPPAHGVCEIGWQDVALGEDGRWALEGEGGSILVNPGRPIPPITQAVHHILEEQVADAPWWHDIARQDRTSVVEGKSVSVRVDLGGRRMIKKKKCVTYHRYIRSPEKQEIAYIVVHKESGTTHDNKRIRRL